MTKFLERLKGLLEAFLKKGAFVCNWVQCVAQILMPLRFSIITIFSRGTFIFVVPSR